MAPRTRTRQRKDRRKWMRNQRRLQQQKDPDQELSRGPFPTHNIVKDTESTTTGQEEVDGSQEKDNDSVTTYNNESIGGTIVSSNDPKKNQIDDGDKNTNQNQNGHQQLHQADCLCILRRQSCGKNFFLPPPCLSSATEHPDDYYCHNI